jgi:hypothetical protein
MSIIKNAKKELQEAYKQSGVLIINEALEIIDKYQTTEEGSLPEFGIKMMQEDAMVLTALNFTLQSYWIQYEAEADKAKAKIKFEKARQFNLLKKSDTKKSDKVCEYEADEATYQFILEEIDKRKASRYLDVAWQRTVDVVNMLKKMVERAMWQGPQPT